MSNQWPPQGNGGSDVSSLNSLTGAITLIGAGGITITPSGSDITITGSETAAGSNTQIQYNDSGSFGASADFTFTDSPAILTLGTAGGSIISTATPTTLNLGNTYSSAAGTNIKLTLLDNTENQTGTGPYGFGVSSLSMDLLSGSNFSFYSGGTKTIFISNAGIFPATAGSGLIGYSGGPFASVNANAFYVYDDSSDQIASFTEVSSGLQIMNAFPTAPLAIITADNATGNTGGITIQPGASTGNVAGSILLQGGGGSPSAFGAVSLLDGSGLSSVQVTQTVVRIISSTDIDINSQGQSGSNNSGVVNIETGSTIDGTAGTMNITAGNASGIGTPGNINITAGGSASGQPGGFVGITGGATSDATQVGGEVTVIGGYNTTDSTKSGSAILADGSEVSVFTAATTGVNITAANLPITLVAKFLTLPTASTDPTAPAGSCYWNTTLLKIRIYNGTSWQSVTAV